MITAFGWVIMFIYLLIQVMVVRYVYTNSESSMTTGMVTFSACLNFMLLWYASILFMVIGMFDLGMRIYSAPSMEDPISTKVEAWVDFAIGTFLWVLMFSFGRV